jgi:hypothetical protein
MYPLLTIGFNVLTFGNLMQDRLTHWIKNKKEGKSTEFISSINIDSIVENICYLKNKNKINTDTIRDYYKFYKQTDCGINKFFNINDSTSPIIRPGRVELDVDIRPFEGKVFDNYLDTRNSIEHRGTVEASLQEAFWAFSGLYLILNTSFYLGFHIEIKSNIFPDKKVEELFR